MPFDFAQGDTVVKPSGLRQELTSTKVEQFATMVCFTQIGRIADVGILANRLNFASKFCQPISYNKNTGKWLKHMM